MRIDKPLIDIIHNVCWSCIDGCSIVDMNAASSPESKSPTSPTGSTFMIILKFTWWNKLDELSKELYPGTSTRRFGFAAFG